MKRKSVLTVFLSSFFAIAVSAQEVKYEIKSAIITKEISAMGQKFESTSYVDDFGKKEAIEMSVENGVAPGIDKHIQTIVDSASIINVDLDSRTATRIKLPEKPLNYLYLTSEIREKYKVQETGEEEIAGKTCKKFSQETTQMGQTFLVKTSVWKGFVLKIETFANGKLFSTETVTEIKENVKIPPGKFIVPEGITITE
jgi:hypothetical protein